MANPQHLSWLQEGVSSWNERRRTNPFDPDLSSEDISRALGGHEREDIRQISVNLREINFTGANLSNSTLRDTDLTGAAFLIANLNNAKLTGSDFTAVRFVGGEARGAQFHSAKFNGTLFLQYDLTAAQFNGAALRETRFLQCTLSNSHFYNEDLTGTEFIRSEPGPLYYTGRPPIRMLVIKHLNVRISTALTTFWIDAANSERHTETKQSCIFGAKPLLPAFAPFRDERPWAGGIATSFD